MTDRRVPTLVVISLLLLNAADIGAETFWSSQNGKLLAFDLDVATGTAALTMQSSGDRSGRYLYFAVARHPTTGELWVNYYDNVSGRLAIGRLFPGDSTPESGVAWGHGARSLAFSPGGALHALYSDTGFDWQLATIDLETGESQTVLTAPAGEQLASLAFHPQTGILHLAGQDCSASCTAFVDAVTIPGYERARAVVGPAYGPPHILFGGAGELFLMMGNFYRVDGDAVVYAGQPPSFDSPFGDRFEYLFEAATAEGTTGCDPTPTRACLQNRRIAVDVTYDATLFGQSAGPATPRLESDENVAFTFFDPTNIELSLKVIDGCGFNGHYWIYASGLTNVGVSMDIVDTVAGTLYEVDRPAGAAFAPLADIQAIPCGP
jgi:hypothetical protein